MRVQLPNGLIDGQDHFNIVYLDELRGKQQNYLADKNLAGNVGHVEKIVSDMITSLETEEGIKYRGEKEKLPWLLPITDLETILIKVRENTFGPKYFFKLPCNHCGEESKEMQLDLSTLEVAPIKLEDMVNAKKRTIKLPKSKLKAELKPLYLTDLMKILKITKDESDKLITSLAALSLKKLGENSPVLPAHLDDLPVMDMTHLGDVVQSDNEPKGIKLEGSIDTEIEFDCAHCGKEAQSKLNVFDPFFLAHSATSSMGNT